jgi:hypothetical protein
MQKRTVAKYRNLQKRQGLHGTEPVAFRLLRKINGTEKVFKRIDQGG